MNIMRNTWEPSLGYENYSLQTRCFQAIVKKDQLEKEQKNKS